jgi:hypothetical protein
MRGLARLGRDLMPGQDFPSDGSAFLTLHAALEVES